MPPNSSNPGSPKEAVAWFRKRVPMRKEEWKALEQRAQEKAFTIAGVAQLDLIAEVQAELAKALKKGTTLDDFKKAVSEKLEKAWGEERAWHVETIFRNATQRAYQAGRRDQLFDADTLAVRPYLKAEPILDTRTTVEICRPLAGVVLPAVSPFWSTHWPPLHHQCRTSIRSLTQAQAVEAGLTKGLPHVDPGPGFGGADPLAWEPDLTGYPAALVKVFKRGQ